MRQDQRGATLARMATATTGSSAGSVPEHRAARGRAAPGRWLVAHRSLILAATALAALVAGGLLHLTGAGAAGDGVWRVAVALLAAELAVEVAHTVLVEHRTGVDTIALLAMVGSLALGEELAGLVVGLMYSGGSALEDYATARAGRELTALVGRAPKTAQLRVGESFEEVPVDQVGIGDRALVRTGEVVPIDGVIVSREAVLDTSALTGEPLPVTLTEGQPVQSGTANAGPPFEVRADRPASESSYAALVRLVQQAQSQRAPVMRMADRYAGIFLPVTVIVAGAAWVGSGDAVRALAVLVVATPCPLILATPVALVSGVSRPHGTGSLSRGPR